MLNLNKKEKSLFSGILFGIVIVMLYISMNMNINIYYVILSLTIFLVASFLLFFKHFEEKFSFIFHFSAGILIVIGSLVIYIIFFQNMKTYFGGIISIAESILSFFGIYLLLNSAVNEPKRVNDKEEIKIENTEDDSYNDENDGDDEDKDMDEELNRIDRL